jgi:hypothetical protein
VSRKIFQKFRKKTAGPCAEFRPGSPHGIAPLGVG